MWLPNKQTISEGENGRKTFPISNCSINFGTKTRKFPPNYIKSWKNYPTIEPGNKLNPFFSFLYSNLVIIEMKLEENQRGIELRKNFFIIFHIFFLRWTWTGDFWWCWSSRHKCGDWEGGRRPERGGRWAGSRAGRGNGLRGGKWDHLLGRR